MKIRTRNESIKQLLIGLVLSVLFTLSHANHVHAELICEKGFCFESGSSSQSESQNESASGDNTDGQDGAADGSDSQDNNDQGLEVIEEASDAADENDTPLYWWLIGLGAVGVLWLLLWQREE